MINFGRVPPVAVSSAALKADWGIVTLAGSGGSTYSQKIKKEVKRKC